MRSLGPGWLVLMAVACQAPVPDAGRASQAIVRGTVDQGDPAVVYLKLDGSYDCTGTLVAPRVVLTARHCLERVGQIDVFFGTETSGAGAWFRAVDVLLHPQGRREDFDVALLTLDAPGPVAPIPYFGGDLAAHVGEPVRIVGFGTTSENGTDTGTKRQGSTVLDSVDAATMVAGATGANTCYGDSGGPNFMVIEGVETIVGITSYGTSLCGYPYDISARVDPYHDWISAYIQAHDVPVAPDAGVAPPDAGSRAGDSGAPRLDAQPSDAGPADAGAVDAGYAPFDSTAAEAGALDAGVLAPDSGAVEQDAGEAADAVHAAADAREQIRLEPGPVEADAGCGCHAARQARRSAEGWGLLLLGLLGLRRRTVG